jgi:hypothetical protein
LHLTQPVVRGLHRNATWIANKRLRRIAASHDEPIPPGRRISAVQRELDWETTNGIGRERFLDALVQEARRNNWPGDFCGGWVPWDVELIADPWHHVVIHTATEELGSGKRFTRVRWTATPTKVKRAVAACAIAWSAASVAAQLTWAIGVGGVACGVLVLKFIQSRRRCLGAVAELIRNAARLAGLEDGDSTPTPRPELLPADADRNDQSPRHVSNGHTNGHSDSKANESHRQPIGQN